MGRKTKFSKEIKLLAVKQYNDGIKSYEDLRNELGCYLTTVRTWVKNYEALGETAFDDKPKNKAYSKELKLLAINDYMNGIGSLSDIAKRYGIYSTTTLRKWIIRYNSHKEIKDYNPKGDIYMTKSRKTTYEEKVKIVNYCLEHEKSYKLAAEQFKVPYNQVYQWVQKYLEKGEQGILDGRGRTSMSQN